MKRALRVATELREPRSHRMSFRLTADTGLEVADEVGDPLLFTNDVDLSLAKSSLKLWCVLHDASEAVSHACDARRGKILGRPSNL